MSSDEIPSAGPSSRLVPAWRVFSAPAKAVWFLVAVDLAGLIGAVVAGYYAHFTADAAWRTVLLVFFAIAFEEVSRRAGRLRILLSGHLQPDMTSVWLLAAALTLPPTYTVICAGLLLCNLWFRIWRPAGGLLYRKVEAAATIILACLASAGVRSLLDDHLFHSHGVVPSLVAIVLALATYSLVNRGLITIAIVLEDPEVSLKDLRGTWDDNMLEAATLCLGGLVALAIPYQPLLATLALLPMVLLQRGALVRQLEVAATTDSKTGLLNAIAWEQLAQRDLARSQREGKPLSVMIIDADKFKWVNDVHGHLVGDIVLKAIGEALTHELRGYDTVGRFGGEEFVASLPNADEHAALAVAERVRARINGIRISDLITLDDPETDRALAVSIGVACTPADGTELTELLHASDGALYIAKESGRNRVALAARGTGGTPRSTPVG